MDSKRITLDQGAGGEASHRLVLDTLLRRLDNPFLRTLDDSALIPLPGSRIAMTTDSYVVDPIFFPGGNIGSLAVHGTVNDLCMQGAVPKYLTLGLILEEGFPMGDFEKIVDSLSEAAMDAGVLIVAGDTKVVPKGHADKIFINTAGIGIVPEGVDVSAANACPGDAVLINGHIGDHGMAILSCREGLDFTSPLQSDSSALNALVTPLMKEFPDIHVLRDPTRGGVATALNEIARQSGVGIHLDEDRIPIHAAVSASCEMLGLDPLYMANEGKCLVIVPEIWCEKVLKMMKNNKYGIYSKKIGRITGKNQGKVLIKTNIGGTRILRMMTGEPLPRIC